MPAALLSGGAAGTFPPLHGDCMNKPRHSALPPNLAPLGLDRVEAAAFIGVSMTLFDQLVREGSMPQPRMAKGRLVWHRTEVEKAFSALPIRSAEGAGGAASSWAGVGVQE